MNLKGCVPVELCALRSDTVWPKDVVPRWQKIVRAGSRDVVMYKHCMPAYCAS